MSEHPTQPVERDEGGVLRFKKNKLVEFLYNTSSDTLNTLALMPFDDEDRAQFAQLIGYSVSGFGKLPYVDGADWGKIGERLRLEQEAK